MSAVKVLSIAAFCAVLVGSSICQEAEFEAGINALKQLDLLPQWVPCNYTETQGSTCKDCHTRFICTKIGGFERPCWYPFRRNCVEGRCVPQPSEECTPSTPPPPPETTTTSTAEPETDVPEETDAPETEAPEETDAPETEAPEETDAPEEPETSAAPEPEEPSSE